MLSKQEELSSNLQILYKKSGMDVCMPGALVLGRAESGGLLGLAGCQTVSREKSRCSRAEYPVSSGLGTHKHLYTYTTHIHM